MIYFIIFALWVIIAGGAIILVRGGNPSGDDIIK